MTLIEALIHFHESPLESFHKVLQPLVWSKSILSHADSKS